MERRSSRCSRTCAPGRGRSCRQAEGEVLGAACHPVSPAEAPRPRARLPRAAVQYSSKTIALQRAALPTAEIWRACGRLARSGSPTAQSGGSSHPAPKKLQSPPAPGGGGPTRESGKVRGGSRCVSRGLYPAALPRRSGAGNVRPSPPTPWAQKPDKPEWGLCPRWAWTGEGDGAGGVRLRAEAGPEPLSPRQALSQYLRLLRLYPVLTKAATRSAQRGGGLDGAGGGEAGCGGGRGPELWPVTQPHRYIHPTWGFEYGRQNPCVSVASIALN